MVTPLLKSLAFARGPIGGDDVGEVTRQARGRSRVQRDLEGAMGLVYSSFLCHLAPSSNAKSYVRSY